MPRAFLSHFLQAATWNFMLLRLFILLVIQQILSQFSLANFTYTLNHKEEDDVMASCRLVKCFKCV